MNRISLQFFMKNIQFGLTNNQLKVIAMISMLIDHVGMEIFPEYKILRIIGRLAFPIFAYMIAEGCFHTRNRKKYLLLMSGLGIGCQAVYTIVCHSFYMNILITFSLSVITIFAIDKFRSEKSQKSLFFVALTFLSVIFISVIAPVIFKEKGFEIDYGFLGIMLPVAVYYSPTKWAKFISASAVLLAMTFVSGKILCFSLPAIPLLILYNGKRGKRNMKYVFYIFYPAHLALIYTIDKII